MTYASTSVTETKLDTVPIGIGSDGRSRYMLGGSSLGYINCDRWSGDKREKLNVTVPMASNRKAEVNLFFSSQTAVMKGYRTEYGYEFPSLPKGEPVKILIVEEGEDELLFSMSHATVGQEFEIIQPGHMTLVDFEREVTERDRLGTVNVNCPLSTLARQTAITCIYN